MSHFTEIKTSLKNQKHLSKALENLACSFEYNPEGCQVMGFYGDSITAEFSIKTETDYDLGLRKNSEGHYEFVADFEMLEAHKVDVESLQNQIQQQYSLVQVKEKLSEQGFELNEQTVDQDGNIQLMVSQW